MNKKALDQLVRILGMQLELAPILESNDGYERFERAVNEILRYYETHPFPTSIKLHYKTHPPINNSPESLDSFRKYFGIGSENREAKTFEEIGKEKGVSRERIRQRVNPIIGALELKHKKDIWYGALGISPFRK